MEVIQHRQFFGRLAEKEEDEQVLRSIVGIFTFRKETQSLDNKYIHK